MKKIGLLGRSDLKETEDHWQVLYLVELRYPGFTREVRHKYYEMIDEYYPSPTEEQISQKIYDCCEPEISDLGNEGINLQLQELCSVDPVGAVTVWLKEVIEYETSFNKMTVSEIDGEFRQALKLASIPVAKPQNDIPHSDVADYTSWLRYAVWRPEEAVEFSLGGTGSDDYEKRLVDLKQEISVNPLLKPLMPQSFLKWALQQKWQMHIKYSDLPEHDDNTMDFVASKTKSCVYHMVISMLKDKYGYKVDRSDTRVAGDVADATANQGYKVSEPVVSRIISEIWEELDRLGHHDKI